jgi:acetyl coenzyme A synthetase (ADP forming)-like protein
MIKQIFEPESIAIIGASNNTKKWGGNVLYNLIRGGYKGKIYPINPKDSVIQGLKAYNTVLDVPDSINMAVIVVPSNVVLQAIKECGEKGIKAVVMITAGFREVGNKKLEDELILLLKKYEIRMIGPNCLGILNIDKNINVSVVQETPKIGGISFIAQSGTMGISIVEKAVINNVGLNKIISVGNKADVDDVDLLEYLEKDETTKVIVIYAESIARGKEFIRVAKNIKKPIIILKAGRSKKGSKAAFSHTGSMSGSDEIYGVAFKQAGVIRVEEMEELFDAAIVFSQNIPKGNRVGIIANGGGAGIVATDLCEKYNIEIPNIEESTKVYIKPHLKEFGTASNPTDTAADYAYTAYQASLEGMFNDPNIDSVVVIYVHTGLAIAKEPAQAIIDVSKKYNKPIISCFFGGGSQCDEAIKMIENAGVPNYTTPERAIRALNYLLTQKKIMEKKL